MIVFWNHPPDGAQLTALSPLDKKLAVWHWFIFWAGLVSVLIASATVIITALHLINGWSFSLKRDRAISPYGVMAGRLATSRKLSRRNSSPRPPQAGQVAVARPSFTTPQPWQLSQATMEDVLLIGAGIVGTLAVGQ